MICMLSNIRQTNCKQSNRKKFAWRTFSDVQGESILACLDEQGFVKEREEEFPPMNFSAFTSGTEKHYRIDRLQHMFLLTANMSHILLMILRNNTR